VAARWTPRNQEAPPLGTVAAELVRLRLAPQAWLANLVPQLSRVQAALRRAGAAVQEWVALVLQEAQGHPTQESAPL
jgi:hypothetical protein